MFPKKLVKQIIEDFSAFGSLPFYLFLSFLVLFLGSTLLFWWLVTGLGFAYALTIIIRLFYHKDRPVKRKHANILQKLDVASFPSLHSFRITLILLLVGSYYKTTYLIILLATTTLLVLYSRYYLKKHFVIDVVFGFIFGAVSSVIIVVLFS